MVLFEIITEILSLPAAQFVGKTVAAEAIKQISISTIQKLKQVKNKTITQPQAYVAVPTIQAMSYCLDNEVLRELYANLLANSMIKENLHLAHPAFVEIIKQLSPLDGENLGVIAGGIKPVAKIGVASSDANFTAIPVLFLANDEYKFSHLQPPSIDNLFRLGLIFLDFNQIVTSYDYSEFNKHPFIKQMSVLATDFGGKPNLSRGSTGLTPFGMSFHETCGLPPH